METLQQKSDRLNAQCMQDGYADGTRYAAQCLNRPCSRPHIGSTMQYVIESENGLG
jgi:hypothetical protein